MPTQSNEAELKVQSHERQDLCKNSFQAVKVERPFWFDRSLSSSQNAWFLPRLILCCCCCCYCCCCAYTQTILPKFSFPVVLQDVQMGQICSCFTPIQVDQKQTRLHIFESDFSFLIILFTGVAYDLPPSFFTIIQIMDWLSCHKTYCTAESAPQ